MQSELARISIPSWSLLASTTSPAVRVMCPSLGKGRQEGRALEVLKQRTDDELVNRLTDAVRGDWSPTQAM